MRLGAGVVANFAGAVGGFGCRVAVDQTLGGVGFSQRNEHLQSFGHWSALLCSSGRFDVAGQFF